MSTSYIPNYQNNYANFQNNNNYDKSVYERKISELQGLLNNANNIIASQKREIEELKTKNNSLISMNNNQINILKNENLNSKNQIIMFNNLINNLKNEIMMKNNQINQLMQQIQNINLNNNINSSQSVVKKKDMKSVTFTSVDQKIFFSVPCSGLDTFAVVEEKLYKAYPEYRETNNTFMANGKVILRFKTINENKIGTGWPVILNKPE